MKYHVVILLIFFLRVSNSFFVDNVDENFYTLHSYNNVSQACAWQSQVYYKQLKTGEDNWAIRMMDASFKFEAGMLARNYLSIGSFDQCVEIDEDLELGKLYGKYCTFTLFVPKMEETEIIKTYEKHTNYLGVVDSIPYEKNGNSVKVGVKWAICVPNECTVEDLNLHLNNYFQRLNPGYSVQILENECQLRSNLEYPITFLDCTIILVFVIAIGTVLVVGWLDYFYNFFKIEKPASAWWDFSWYANGKELFSSQAAPEFISCLSGIRVLSTLMVISTHEYVWFLTKTYIYNVKDLVQWPTSSIQLFFYGNPNVVDTFFVLSSTCMTYNFLKSYLLKKSYSIYKLYMNRILRILPSLVAIVLFVIGVAIHLDSGPLWKAKIKLETDVCKEYWWATIFDFYGALHLLCVVQVWSLNVDLQLFFISPLLLIPFVKFSKFIVKCIIGILIFIGILLQVYLIFTYNVSMGQTRIFTQNLEVFRYYFTSPYNRFASWIIGMALGYCLFHTRKMKIYLTSRSLIILWIIGAICLSFSLITFPLAAHPSFVSSELFSISILATHRVIWCLGLSWIIFACVNGFAHGLNKFLSHPVFQFTSKLCYAIFLTHYNVLKMKYAASKTPIYYSQMNMFFNLFGTLNLVLIISIFWYLCFEVPYAKLSKRWLK